MADQFADSASIPPITRMAMGRGTWVTVLCRKLKDWWHWVAEGDLPIIASHGLVQQIRNALLNVLLQFYLDNCSNCFILHITEIEMYKALEPATHLVILKAICDIRSEDKPTVRKKPVPSDSPRVKAESGTCNVCCAPCSSCLHRNLVLADSNMYCGSSQTCCTRSETKNSSFVHSKKGLHTKGGENDDEFSATSSHASYSKNGGNKAMARSYIGADSEVDMPAKRRKLLNHDARSLRVECQDDSNSCVTGVSAAGKLLLDKKKDKLSTSASNRDLTVKGYKDNNVASHNILRNYCVEDSTEKKRSDVHVMHPSSSDRSVPADSPSVTKKLLRTQSSVSASQGLSHKRPTHGFGNSGDNYTLLLLVVTSMVVGA